MLRTLRVIGWVPHSGEGVDSGRQNVKKYVPDCLKHATYLKLHSF